MKQVSLKEFYRNKKKDFSLSLITNPETMQDKFITQFLNRPGLALAGYFERFSNDRIQILGEIEISYLQSLDDNILFDRLNELFIYDIPCFIISKGLSAPAMVVDQANENSIAIFSSRKSTENIIHSLKRYLDDLYAPTKSLHGTLVSVYGVGIFITGKSGIGKSECALDLVERGHRLIADDIVQIEFKNDILVGKPKDNYGYFMEIRGVGMIDVERMFGIQAVRDHKQIDIQVELVPWNENVHYERTGSEEKYTMILDVKTPVIYLPISPGKNVSMIFETIAMNFILKSMGYNAATIFSQKVSDAIQRKSKLHKDLLEEPDLYKDG